MNRNVPPEVGSWSVPAGYLEVDESPAACAVRELTDETGLRPSLDALQLHDTVFIEHADEHTILVIMYMAPLSAIEGVPTSGLDAADVWFLTSTISNGNPTK